MSSLKERGKSFEAAYSRDQERAFRITVRRNRLFGLWAAGKMGLAAGEAVEAYAKAVIAADFESPGDDDVVAKVWADLAAQDVILAEVELRAELARCAAEASRQILGFDADSNATTR